MPYKDTSQIKRLPLRFKLDDQNQRELYEWIQAHEGSLNAWLLEQLAVLRANEGSTTHLDRVAPPVPVGGTTQTSIKADKPAVVAGNKVAPPAPIRKIPAHIGRRVNDPGIALAMQYEEIDE